MNTEKRDFDQEAATWDEHPTRVGLAKDVAGAMIQQVAITTGMDALDFGCGTGLLTLRLQPLVRTITGMDSSPGMLDIFCAKVAALKLGNVRSLLHDLDTGDPFPGRYDLIVSSMTLHHIRDIVLLLRQFYTVLAPGGTLCLADLDAEGGRFHEDNTGVFHFGFDRAALRALCIDAGFTAVADVTATEIEKPARDGVMGRYPVFLLTARKG